jgi:hypothetical protein
MKKPLVVITMWIFALVTSSGQPLDGFSGNKDRGGFMIGLTTQNFGPLTVNEQKQYKAFLMKGQYFWVLTKWKTGGVELLFQPQFNLSRLQTSNQSSNLENGLEFGVNVGLLARKNLFKNRSAIYGLISAGPHFITKTTERQASGFIFSDNFAMGFLQNISKKIYLDVRLGYRHLSNAGLQNPNSGIDNWVASFGVYFDL